MPTREVATMAVAIHATTLHIVRRAIERGRNARESDLCRQLRIDVTRAQRVSGHSMAFCTGNGSRPRRAEHVRLVSAHAWDGAGNEVTQTVDRAYGLR